MMNTRMAAPCCNRGGGRSCRELAQQVKELDFAINEVTLYLDAYPDSTPALEYYNSMLALRQQAVEAYEAACGPLTMYGNRGNSWQWVRGPWPWQYDGEDR